MKSDVAAIRKYAVRNINSDRFRRIVDELDDKDYLRFCLEMMEFCLPKLQRTEFTGELTTKETVVFEIAGQKIPFQAVKQN